MRLTLFVAIITVLSITSCNNSFEKKNLSINNYSELDSILNIHRGNDTNIVTPVIIKNIAPSIRNLSTSERKKVFIETIVSNITLSNHNILALRDSVINLSKKKHLDKKDELWLNDLSKNYRCKNIDFDCLLKKIDIIPPSMAVAQAIVESGWGTSRFAIEGNSIFGEHHSNGAKGKHIKADSSDVKMKAFDNIYNAVESYSLNINRHQAYRLFRSKRLEQRTKNGKLNSLELIETLTSYSEQGKQYTDYIKQFITKNNLTKYDEYNLGKPTTIYFVNIKN